MTVADARKRAELAAEARRLGIAEWQLEAMRAVPGDLVRDLVSDFSHGPAQPSSQIAKPDRGPRPASVAVERPLEPPPGIKIIDALCDAQDVKDRAKR